jgi:uncharacterized protein YvpB/LysM repeat protein
MDMMKRLFHIFALVSLLILVDVSTAQGNSLPDDAYVSGLSGHAQSYNLSCEARSAVDLAAFWGLSIGETEFLKALPHSDNPEKGFVGNPNEAWGYIPPHGYGVDASPVADTLRGYGLEATGLSKLSWDDLRVQISSGSPVIVWIIGEMWDGTSVEYKAQDGSTAVVAAFEHTMILTGYNQDTVQVVDAYSGRYETYPLSMFMRSWAVLGNMAVFASRQTGNQDNPPAEAHEESYTVQPGDYLIALAKRFSTSWNEIAELNSIGYPYIIHPGQVLKIPVVAQPVAEPTPEPVAVEPASTNKAVNFQARLPFVQRDYAEPIAPTKISVPSSPEPTPPVIALNSTPLAKFGKSMGVDWKHFVRMKDIILPYFIHSGIFLKFK